jgi:uncharacterized protein YgbK (DUF1537 family)
MAAGPSILLVKLGYIGISVQKDLKPGRTLGFIHETELTIFAGSVGEKKLRRVPIY